MSICSLASMKCLGYGLLAAPEPFLTTAIGGLILFTLSEKEIDFKFQKGDCYMSAHYKSRRRLSLH